MLDDIETDLTKATHGVNVRQFRGSFDVLVMSYDGGWRRSVERDGKKAVLPNYLPPEAGQ